MSNITTSKEAKPPTDAPVAWMRRWYFDGEKPAKVKNENGRWAWPYKFK